MKSILFCVLVCFVWEITGGLVSRVVSGILEPVQNMLYGTYISMFVMEFITFMLMYILFHRLQINNKDNENRKNVLPIWIFVPVVIQVLDNLVILFKGEWVISLFSFSGLKFVLICMAATIFIGVTEEYVWRGVIFNKLLSSWGNRKKGVWLSVIISSLMFGLCHYMNLFSAGQSFSDTTKQVVTAFCMGIFLAGIYYYTGKLIISILVHGICNFSNFLMNEVLGWNYSVWKYDDILQTVLSIMYLFFGIYAVWSIRKYSCRGVFPENDKQGI